MKTIRYAAFLVLSTLFVLQLQAQGFNSGSNGSYGILNVASGTTTLDLPADGILHCTTINVATGAILRFNRNALNTPVYLLATGDATIAGTINVSGNTAGPGNGFTGGQGGPGGFDGGASGFISTGVTRPAGSGQGPGGGTHGTSTTVGSGGFGKTATQDLGTRGHGVVYGNSLLIPLIGGSGGGGVDGSTSPGGGFGGGGGGAVLVASNTKITLSGTISARGGIGNGSSGSPNYGSGGAVRLVAPRVYGNGSVDVSGTSGSNGRVRVDSLFKVDPVDPTQFLSISYTTAAATVGANLIVFPPNNPRLDITQAAGTSIAEGTAQGVVVLLPIDAPTAQSVRVQARNFSAIVPIRVALIPESGDATFFDSTIDNTTTNPATTTVNVTMPTNVKVNIQVWTR